VVAPFRPDRRPAGAKLFRAGPGALACLLTLWTLGCYSLPVPAMEAPSSTQPLNSYLQKLEFPGWQPASFKSWNSQGDTPAAEPQSDVLAGEELNGVLQEFKIVYQARKTLSRGQRNIYIDVYQFENSDFALAAYYYLRKGASTIVKRGDATSEDDASISFAQGRCFVSISASEDDDESKDLVRRIADSIGARLNQTAPSVPPKVLQQLPPLEKLSGSEKLIYGIKSCRRYCSVPYIEALLGTGGEAKELIAGCSADYQFREPYKERLRLTILEFSDRSAALKHYQAFLSEFLANRKIKAEDQGFSPITSFRSGDTYILVELRGAAVALVSGARKRFSPPLLLRQWRAQ